MEKFAMCCVLSLVIAGCAYQSPKALREGGLSHDFVVERPYQLAHRLAQKFARACYQTGMQGNIESNIYHDIRAAEVAISGLGGYGTVIDIEAISEGQSRVSISQLDWGPVAELQQGLEATMESGSAQCGA